MAVPAPSTAMDLEWQAHARRVGYCAHPVRLRGQVHHADVHTGEVREVYSTAREPTGLLLKPCGTRRAAHCPACAEVYRADAYQLIKAGLAGGKGIPESVAEHPAVFATFTAPSFGPVHALRADRHSRPQFTPGILEEAIRLAVAMTTVPVPATPNDPHPRVARWGSQLDIRHLRSGAPGDLSEQAVAGYIAKYATKSTEGYGPALTRRLTPRDLARLDTAQVRPHIARHVRAAWRLGASPHLARLHLQRWAHQLGFGGHFLTRSRRYSTTFTRLRRARATYRRTRGGGIPLDAFGRPDGDDATVILATWTYAGTGWRTDTTRQLAIDAAARAREHRRATRAKRTSAA